MLAKKGKTKVTAPSSIISNVLVLINTRITLQHIFTQPEKQQLQYARICPHLKTLLVIHDKQALASPAIASIPHSGLDSRAAPEQA